MDRYLALVNKNGELVFPEEFVRKYGLMAGAHVCVEETAKGLRLRLPVTLLKKLYIEPTNRCNLECRTCMRNAWNEPMGTMSNGSFSRIMEGLKESPTPPSVFFGGLGEPLSHPDIIEMVAKAKALGSTVELITNGTLLTKQMSEGLIEAGLDRLWVSLDGANPESYGDIRLGALLPDVIENLKVFHNTRIFVRAPSPSPFSKYHVRPEIGIVFVAMKRNFHDLPLLLPLAQKLGVGTVMVTNVIPYSGEMEKEILYSKALRNVLYHSSVYRLDLPKIDVDEVTKGSLYSSLHAGHGLTFARNHFGEGNDYCPFIESGACAIRWDGALSPCLPLLHSHRNHVDGIERFSRQYAVGNVNERPIMALWNELEYLQFRERVQSFDFAPCTYCGGCGLFAENEQDCMGSTFPTCGGCLWAQGIIQCP